MKALRLMLVFAAAMAMPPVPAAERQVTLAEAGARREPDYSPAIEGEEVVVKGVAASVVIPMPNGRVVPITDETGFGLFLQDHLNSLPNIRPGDLLEAHGKIVQSGGMAVLECTSVQVRSHSDAPQNIPLPIEALKGFRYLATPITVESRVISAGANSSGEFILIGDPLAPIKVFLPKDFLRYGGIGQYPGGARVLVSGIAYQYCPFPPFNHYYQILIDSPASVVITGNSWVIPFEVMYTACTALVFALLMWWRRERVMRSQRETQSAINELGEDILGAASPAAIRSRLSASLPQIYGVTTVRIFLYNRTGRTLELIQEEGQSAAVSIDTQTERGGEYAAAAVCYRNRTLLAIPDTQKSPLFQKSAPEGTPRALMLIPMLAQKDLMGVLEIGQQDRKRSFTAEQQTAAQHLANQVAGAFKLLNQRSIQDQLVRSEKLAAAGQLMSGIANELREPLAAVTSLADGLLARKPSPLLERDLQAIADETGRAMEIVNRLVSFSRSEEIQTAPVELSSMLRGLIQFREQECMAKGIELRDQISREIIFVSGIQGQLEQMFLNLLVHAEQSQRAGSGREQVITVSTSLPARRVLIAIGYSSIEGEAEDSDLFEEAETVNTGRIGLGLCKAIIHSHGGEIRLLRTTSMHARFEVELPVSRSSYEKRSEPEGSAGRTLTALVVEADAANQRQLVSILSALGHRVIPVASGEEAQDLSYRMRFDITFCSVRLPGMSWVELMDKLQHQLGSFVLLTEGYDAALAQMISRNEGHILPLPIDEQAVVHLLQSISVPAAVINETP